MSKKFQNNSSMNFAELFSKAQGVAQKMIHGSELSAEEEDSLLMKWAT